MPHTTLPKRPLELLDIPSDHIPDVIRGLMHCRGLSPLMSEIHAELNSKDPVLRRRGREALRHLGFPE